MEKTSMTMICVSKKQTQEGGFDLTEILSRIDFGSCVTIAPVPTNGVEGIEVCSIADVIEKFWGIVGDDGVVIEGRLKDPDLFE